MYGRFAQENDERPGDVLGKRKAPTKKRTHFSFSPLHLLAPLVVEENIKIAEKRLRPEKHSTQ